LAKPLHRLPSFVGIMRTTFNGLFVSVLVAINISSVYTLRRNRMPVVYVIIEAHHRAADPDVSSLWILINKVCKVHPKLIAAAERPDIIAIGRLIVLAWHQRQEHLHRLHQPVEKPWCVETMEKKLNFTALGPKVSDTGSELGTDNRFALDFDMIDWSAWEQDGYVQVLN
jgi:hypothetical protein